MSQGAAKPTGGQEWSAKSYDAHARFVSDLGAEVLSWLAPRAGERILDIGCGDGALTARIAEAGAQVHGVDASTSLLEAARGRGLDVQLMDAQALTIENEFDAVFSNAALHWMLKPREVVRGVRRALKDGGRFVAEFGGHGNVAAIVTAMRGYARARGGDEAVAGPWFYPTPEEYRALLESEGFAVHRIGLYPRPTPLPTGMEGWLYTFRKAFFDQFGDGGREAALAEVVAVLKPSLCDEAGNWTADYVRLRVEATVAGDAR